MVFIKHNSLKSNIFFNLYLFHVFQGPGFGSSPYWEQNIKKPRYLTLSQIFVKPEIRKNVYFSFIHSYIDYDNMTWGSTPKTKLKKIFTFQKKAARVIFFANRLAHTKPLMLDLNAFNVYQINIYQNFYFIKRRYSLISFQRSVIIIRQVLKKLAIIQFLNRQWN